MPRTMEMGSPTEAVWVKVAAALRGELGEGPFNSYVAPSAVRQGFSGSLCLVTPTVYARDWVRRNAMRRLSDLWAQHDPSHRPLDVKSRAEYEIEIPASEKIRDAETAGARAADPAPAEVVDFEGRQAERPMRAAGLQERLSFDSFVVGQGNEFAYAMARQVATWVDGHFNPARAPRAMQAFLDLGRSAVA